MGPELVTNGTFDTDLSGWTVSSAIAVWDSGRALVDTGVFAQDLTSKLVAGKTYRVEFDFQPDLVVYPDGSYDFLFGFGKYQPLGSYTQYLEIIGKNIAVQHFSQDIIFSGGAEEPFILFREAIYIDNVSVKEISGNLYLQTTQMVGI